MTPTTRVAKRPQVSPLRYPGGKSALYPRLRELIRNNGLAGCTYVEPYAGGAGAALSLLATGQVGRIVINDFDPAIAAFWTTLVNNPDLMIKRIQKVRLDVREWKRQKAIYMAANEADMAELGFATFYLNRTNRSGVLNGGPIGGLDQTGNYKIDARFNRDGLQERVRIISLYADKITVSSRDGLDVIREATRRADTFVYADPPYFEKAGSLYLNAFKAANHEALAKIMNGRAKKNWVLTYDNVPQVSALYGARRRVEFGLHYSAHRVTKATEVMVFSDPLDISTTLDQS
ncbi:DNA adenine methylase [Nocardioides anomalus]|uniref:site-specific DNA-methyltransferase (adenine-specific) n=1 Tax=Nocardioides anomalus TaxID=2712223 RepID=A0A6G6WG87_9ACTN|nr:DNA adenine methylase [Nocardioides anomalus]QIG44173.1 DNA adenine methylase [Nocardioides anomalus]